LNDLTTHLIKLRFIKIFTPPRISFHLSEV
jgi:hypothetical protein